MCCCTQEEARKQGERISELETHLQRETGAAAAARDSQEQLRGANMQLGEQLERLEQKLATEHAARCTFQHQGKSADWFWQLTLNGFWMCEFHGQCFELGSELLRSS